MHFHRAEKIWLRLGVAMLAVFMATITAAAIIDGFVPPSADMRIDPAKLGATAPFDHPGLRRIADHEYEAYYIARVFSFAPAELRIPVNSHVVFYATTPDVVHGFSIPQTGVNVMLAPGWVSSVGYRFTKAGTYLLLCNEYCGSAHHLMAGKIIVE